MSERFLAEFGDPVWDEWTAALYESYAADNEAYETEDIMSTNPPLSAHRYASSAHKLCEELEYQIYENRQTEADYAAWYSQDS